MLDKYKYTIYPERKYIVEIDNDKVEISGEDIVNIIPDILRRKYLEAFFGYDIVPFDNLEEGVVE